MVGPCGSGKSTVAVRLARVLGVEATHLDDIHWKPGWVESTPAEEQAALARVLAQSVWVVDGNYSALRGAWRDAVELFVWLDLPLNVTLPRLLSRCLVRAFKRVPCCNGNTESLRGTLFSKESLLLWALTTHQRRKRQLAQELAGRPHVRLRSARAVEPGDAVAGAPSVTGPFYGRQRASPPSFVITRIRTCSWRRTWPR